MNRGRAEEPKKEKADGAGSGKWGALKKGGYCASMENGSEAQQKDHLWKKKDRYRLLQLATNQP